MIFLVFLIIVFDCFVRNAFANQAKSQKNDDNSKDQGWEITEKWVEVDAKICSQIRENDVVKQDVSTQCNQQDTSQQMSALEKLCDFPNTKSVTA